MADSQEACVQVLPYRISGRQYPGIAESWRQTFYRPDAAVGLVEIGDDLHGALFGQLLRGLNQSKAALLQQRITAPSTEQDL